MFAPEVVAWEAFQRNALQYNSSSAPWGLGLIASALDGRLRLYQSDFIQLAGALGCVPDLLWVLDWNGTNLLGLRATRL